MITLGYPTMLFNILSTKMIKLTLYACSYKQLSQQSIICLSTWIKPVNTHHFLKHTPSCHHIFITKNNHKKNPQKYQILTMHTHNIVAISYFRKKMISYHTRPIRWLDIASLCNYTCLFVILKSWLKKKMTCIQLYFNKEKGETNAFLNDRDQFFPLPQ